MDDDNIKLPPLPPRPPVVDGDAAMLTYGRACYKAGVVIGERRAKQEAKPVGCSVNLQLMSDATVRQVVTGGADCNAIEWARVTLRWTADGRAWIESERNRELATRLRLWKEQGRDRHAAADALDGGEG